LDENSPEYWEEVLHREGLNMGAGSNKHLIHSGGIQDLALIEKKVLQQQRLGGRKIEPKPQAE